MRKRVELQTEAARRTIKWQPQDPVWAPVAALSRARRALRDYDACLSIWWSPMRRMGEEQPGRWRVVRYSFNASEWETVFYWEGDNGEYLGSFPKETLLARVQACDLTKQGKNLQEVADEVEHHNERLKAKQKSEAAERAWRVAHDKAEHAAGAKRTYATAKVDG